MCRQMKDVVPEILKVPNEVALPENVDWEEDEAGFDLDFSDDSGDEGDDEGSMSDASDTSTVDLHLEGTPRNDDSMGIEVLGETFYEGLCELCGMVNIISRYKVS